MKQNKQKIPNIYISLTAAEDGALRFQLIQGGVPLYTHTPAPEVAQQQYLRLFHPKEIPPDRIPVWNGIDAEFTNFEWIIQKMESHDIVYDKEKKHWRMK